MPNTGGVRYTHLLQLREDKTVWGGTEGGRGNVVQPDHAANHVTMQLVSLASHTLRREKEGLVTLQLLSCCRGTQLSTIAVR